MPLDTVLLVRHDTSRSNRRGYVQGQMNTRLEQGFVRRIYNLTDLIVREEGQTLSQTSPINIFCSVLDRTYETADRMHRRFWDEYSLKSTLHPTELLNERGQGQLEGLRFEQALPLLSSEVSLSPDSQTVYGLLYISNNIPNGESHESVGSRLEQFAGEYVHSRSLNGTGIISSHLIFGMNYLNNLLKEGNMLAQPYRHYPNLSVVKLSRDTKSSMRYVETGHYGPPNQDNELRSPLITSRG